MSPELLKLAMERATKIQLPNFSAYVRKLIQDDLASRAPLSFGETSEPTEHPAPERPVNYGAEKASGKRKKKVA